VDGCRGRIWGMFGFFEDKDVPLYDVRRSKRAKRVSLRVSRGGEAVLVMPYHVSEAVGRRFVTKNIDWLNQNIEKMKRIKVLPSSLLPRGGVAHYKKHRESARALVREKLTTWSRYYNVQYKRVSIRNTKSRWGSCSKEGNLNFSYRILFLPERLQDYLIVHELCHIMELNHSRGFWVLVAKAVPDYKTRKRELLAYR